MPSFNAVARMRKRLPPSSHYSSLESLPSELLSIILQFMEVPTFLRCRQLSRRFNSLISNSISLEYNIELFANNCIDGFPSEQPTPTKKARLARLRQHQRAWNNLTWSQMIPIPLNETELKIPYLTSWELLGGILGLADHRSLRFIRLPSPLRGISQTEWRYEDVGFNIRDFTMDRSLDLVVLLEHADFDGPDSDKGVLRVHLHSLKTGLGHAQAQKEVITFTSTLVKNEGVPEAINYVLQIFGNIVAVMITKKDMLGTAPVIYSSELILWNWRSGDVQKIACGPIHGFTFLTQDLVLLAMCRPGSQDAINSDHVSLDLISIAGPGLHFDVAPLPHPNKLPIVSFSLPPLSNAQEPGAGRIQRSYLTLRSDYSPAWEDSQDGVPFSTSPSDRLCVLLIRNMIPSQDSVAMFFRLSSILEISSKDTLRGCTIPWKEWGPKHTRMTHRELDDNWFCYVHGLKAIVPSHGGENALELWDFNSPACRRGHNLLKHRKAPRPPRNFYPSSKFRRQDYYTNSEELESSFDDEWDTKRIFAEKIITSLPYRSQTVASPIKHDRQVFMMTEDCLVSVVDDRDLYALCF